MDLVTIIRSESFPLRVTGWPVELMAYAFLVVSPPEMIQLFEEVSLLFGTNYFQNCVHTAIARVVNTACLYYLFVQMAVAASNKGSSKPAVNYPELDEQALQFILDCCESSIKKYTKYLEVRSCLRHILQISQFPM